MKGLVLLVGAGPGDPDLLTVRAAREIAHAEVLLYDALIDPALLDLAPEGCERIDVGKRGDGSRGVPQDDITHLMIAKARAGYRVVRLKGGDPFVFGRGGEEATALARAGIPFEVVPGVSSAVAVPAYAGIPVTDRRRASSVAVVTGHRGRQATDERIDWEGLARSAETLVVLMGTAWLEDIVARVIAGGRDPDVPAAVIERGTGPRQRTVHAPLHALADRVRAAGLRAPTVVVIGEVVRFRESLAWYERRPLFGRRVLVTREVTQAGGLTSLLRARAAEPVPVPLLEFRDPEDPGPLDRALEKLDRYDWIVFTSANAVRAVSARLGSTDVPAGARVPARIGCVGNATADAARAAGLEPTVIPARPDADLLADGMAALGDLDGVRVLLPRARHGREELLGALRSRGAAVDLVEAYRTACPPDAGPALRAAVAAGIDAVTLMSPSAVHHLCGLLGDEVRALAERAVVACVGPTTAATIREVGIDPDVIAERASAEGLVDALEEYFGRETHDISS